MMDWFDEDLPPELSCDADRDRILEVAKKLEAERPLLRAAARGTIRRRLATQRPITRPSRLRVIVASLACAGTLCLAGAALGLTQDVDVRGNDARPASLESTRSSLQTETSRARAVVAPHYPSGRS
jgi:hypothetical protein